MYGLRYRGSYPTAIAEELDAMLSAIRAWLSVDHNEDGTHNLRPSGFDFVPIGATMLWGSTTPPARWLVCDGNAVSRATYQGLFSVIGTTYGIGDGSTTFNLPDMRQRFALGKAAAGTGASMGGTGGAIDHDHDIASGGGHTHTVSGHTHTISTEPDHIHAIAFRQEAVDGGGAFALLDSNETEQGGSHNHGGATGSATPGTDSQGAHDHGGTTDTSNPPYLVWTYIILAGA